MKFIKPRTSESAAMRFFHRRRPGNLWGLLGRRSRRTNSSTNKERRLPFAELVWLPYYIIPVKVRSRRGEGEITVSVEGYSGAFAVFEMHADVVEGDIEEETFRPKLDAQDAARIARKQLLATIMRQRSNREKPAPEQVLGVDLLHWPLWVYYYERRRGRLDIRVLDAVTGSKPGPRLKASILAAFISAKENAP
jgi:hypothetical protein